MKTGMTGVVFGAAAGVVVYFVYLLAQLSAIQMVPDAPAILFGLQMTTGLGAAAGGWIGVLIALLSSRGHEHEVFGSELTPSAPGDQSRADDIAA